MTTGRNVRSGSCARVGDVARRVEDGSEALGMVVNIFFDDGEMARWRCPTWLTGSYGSDQADFAIF
jgi:hypothetical protein